jgi:hypothetical protein
MHRIAVSNEIKPPFEDELTIDAGSMASLDTVLNYQKEERYLVGQALTEDLPYVFELIPAKETKLDMIPSPNKH